PNEEFYFTEGDDRARLARLRQGPHSIEFRYTDQGVLREITDSRGRRIRISADAAGRILALTLDANPAQPLLTYEYDRAGNLVRATDVFRTTLSFAYDAANRMTRRTDRRGYSFHFEYDELGRCIHSRGDDGFLEVFLDYQPDSRVTLVRRGDGGQWVYHYDDRRCITQITDPYGNATQFIQDDLGRTVQEIDPNGNVTTLHYNEAGQHDYRIDPNGHVLPTRADNPTPPDPLAYKLPPTPLQWDFGKLVAAEDVKPPTANDPLLGLFPAPVVNTVLGKTTTYDAAATADTVGTPQAVVADDRGQSLEETGPRFTERWKYDPNANLIEHQDRDGSVYRNTYKSWNALAEAIDPLGRVTAFDYSVQGQPSKVTDAGGTVVEYAYDWNEKLVEIRQQGQVRERYRRDKAGNIVEKTDAQGRVLAAWEYGAGNLEKTRTLGNGEKHAFEYDARGRVTSASAPTGTATFAYDGLGRLLLDLRDGVGVAHEFDLGQLVGTTYFDKFRVSYATQDNGDVVVRDPTGAAHRFQRGVTGLLVKSLANGTRELSQFDPKGRCRRKAVLRSGQSSAWMRSYTYSAAGDLLAISDTQEGVTQYRYDATHRLTEELGGSKPRPYQFDAAGNLNLQPGLNDVSLDAGNRLRTANGDRFTYNDRDHLATREGAAGKTRYEYDSLDRLVK
ncbi:MAG: RHS repeat protein, partial [Planctomycetia bacterium]|nr:RHS repeat protein [Planctomycetia bacterium]